MPWTHSKSLKMKGTNPSMVGPNYPSKRPSRRGTLSSFAINFVGLHRHFKNTLQVLRCFTLANVFSSFDVIRWDVIISHFASNKILKSERRNLVNIRRRIIRWVVYNQLFEWRFLFVMYCPDDVISVNVPPGHQRDRKMSESSISVCKTLLLSLKVI